MWNGGGMDISCVKIEAGGEKIERGEGVILKWDMKRCVPV